MPKIKITDKQTTLSSLKSIKTRYIASSWIIKSIPVLFGILNFKKQSKLFKNSIFESVRSETKRKKR
jgi:hypothetical protein